VLDLIPTKTAKAANILNYKHSHLYYIF